MMRKISKTLFLCGMVVALTACGKEAAPAGNLAQDINIGAGGSGSVKEGNDKEAEETEAADQESSKEEEGVFCFVYEGTALVPGELVDHSVLPKYSDVAEVPSCAFGGNDNVYNFEKFELTAYVDGDEERVYSIYFIDPNLSTTEGLSLGDTVDDMRSLYGENYEEEGASCIYTRGATKLFIITRDDIVVSIEYRLDR